MSEVRAVGVVGGGTFGRAIAQAVTRRGGHVRMLSRRPPDLPDVTGTEDPAALAQTTLVFVAVPSTHIHAVAPKLAAHLDGRHLLVHVSRGLIGEQLDTVSRFLRERTPCRRVGCLAGPIGPEVLAEGSPGGGVVGTGFPEVVAAVRNAIGGPRLRLYETDDTHGTEVASAMAGLLALAAGFCQEIHVSPGALAMMLNRGLVEAARVGTLLGGRAETFHGLAGAGDLLAAVAGDDRAELKLGRALAQGVPLEEAGRAAGAHIEGLSIARRVGDFARRTGIRAPIATSVADVLERRLTPEQVVEGLMAQRNP